MLELRRLGKPPTLGTGGLIIEGITGVGKTQTLRALQRSPELQRAFRSLDIFREKETFGNFMTELMENPDAPPAHKLRRLNRVIQTVQSRSQRHPSYGFILERAHYSYYALLPDWSLYEETDALLASLNTLIVLLRLPVPELKTRSLYRIDRDPKWWARGFVDHYKSETNALSTFEQIQERRYQGIQNSILPHIVIDTSAMSWDRYAEMIVTAFLDNQRGPISTNKPTIS